MRMSWHDLAFLHWRVDANALANRLPPGLVVDTFDGSAWLGVVPFRMVATGIRGCPRIPGLHAFPELNVRTYVRHGDRAGVWFFSLDATSRLAVRAARATFHLPYFDAAIDCRRDGDAVHYTSRRTHRGAPPAELAVRYAPNAPNAPLSHAARGTLEHFLVERYCLFAADRRGRLRCGEIHHPPWQVAPADVAIERCSMTALAGCALPNVAPHALVAAPIDVVAWWTRRV
jgi:uncharacterized protein YqjF (DUF2071 family)